MYALTEGTAVPAAVPTQLLTQPSEDKGKQPLTLLLQPFPIDLPELSVDRLTQVLASHEWSVIDTESHLIPLADIRTAMQVAMNEIKGFPLTPLQIQILSEINRSEYRLSGSDMVKLATNTTPKISGGDNPLYTDRFTREEVLKAYLNFLEVGGETQQWKFWFPLFADHAIYIADGKTAIINRDQIRKVIGGQLLLVPFMTYETIGFTIQGNRIIMRSVNVMKLKDSTQITFINDTTLYYNGKSFSYDEDMIDKACSKNRVLSYAFKNWGALLTMIWAGTKQAICCGAQDPFDPDSIESNVSDARMDTPRSPSAAAAASTQPAASASGSSGAGVTILTAAAASTDAPRSLSTNAIQRDTIDIASLQEIFTKRQWRVLNRNTQQVSFPELLTEISKTVKTAKTQFALSPSQSAILKKIEERSFNLTTSEMVQIVTSKALDGIPSTQLFQDFPEVEVRAAFLHFMESVFYRREIDKSVFASNAVTIPNSNDVLMGPDDQRSHLLKRMGYHSDMQYQVIDFGIDSNRVIARCAITVKGKDGKTSSFVNDFILYYAGNGQFKYFESLNDLSIIKERREAV